MLLITDFNTHLYTEIINTISRDNDNLLQEAIDAAEGQAKGYLSRFDVSNLFSQTGGDRDKTLLMYLKDIAVWHYLPVGNPSVDIEYRKQRYQDALQELMKIQSGKVTPYGWKLASEETQDNSIISVSSNRKRTTHF